MAPEVLVCKRCGAQNSPAAPKCKRCHGSITFVRRVAELDEQPRKSAPATHAGGGGAKAAFSWPEEESSEHKRRVEAAREAERARKENEDLAEMDQQMHALVWIASCVVALSVPLLAICFVALVGWSEGGPSGAWEAVKFVVQMVYDVLSGGY
jgi:hypothetical protein